MEIKHNSRQIPKSNEICSNKKYYDILYAYLQCISKRNEDGKRIFLKKQINFTQLGDYFNLSRQTISTKFKNLKELGLIKEIDSATYEIVVLDRDLASLVPYPTLKLLLDSLNENSISTYVYLFNRYYANNCQGFVFTFEQIKKFIGICASTRSNDETISNILFVLQKIGLIKYNMKALPQEESNFQNIKTVYEIEWIKNTVC